MKTAIITGASSGLGREFARQLADVFPEIECCWLIARREDRLEEMQPGRWWAVETVCLPLDLCDPASFAALEDQPGGGAAGGAAPGQQRRLRLSGADGRGHTDHADPDGGPEPPGHDGGDEPGLPYMPAGGASSTRPPSPPSAPRPG